jgi:hypothetical protein
METMDLGLAAGRHRASRLFGVQPPGCPRIRKHAEAWTPNRVGLSQLATLLPEICRGATAEARVMGTADLQLGTRIGAMDRSALGTPHLCGRTLHPPRRATGCILSYPFILLPSEAGSVHATPPSPSPLPSPLGRGNRWAAPAKLHRAVSLFPRGKRGSLSPRERVRVRGKEIVETGVPARFMAWNNFNKVDPRRGHELRRDELRESQTQDSRPSHRVPL